MDKKFKKDIIIENTLIEKDSAVLQEDVRGMLFGLSPEYGYITGRRISRFFYHCKTIKDKVERAKCQLQVAEHLKSEIGRPSSDEEKKTLNDLEIKIKNFKAYINGESSFKRQLFDKETRKQTLKKIPYVGAAIGANIALTAADIAAAAPVSIVLGLPLRIIFMYLGHQVGEKIKSDAENFQYECRNKIGSKARLQCEISFHNKLIPVLRQALKNCTSSNAPRLMKQKHKVALMNEIERHENAAKNKTKRLNKGDF